METIEWTKVVGEITYEQDGILTVCPCCGGGLGANARDAAIAFACPRCAQLVSREWRCSDDGSWTLATRREFMYQAGIRFRAEGKLPPLGPFGANEPVWGVRIERRDATSDWALLGNKLLFGTWHEADATREALAAWYTEVRYTVQRCVSVADKDAPVSRADAVAHRSLTAHDLFCAMVRTDPALDAELERRASEAAGGRVAETRHYDQVLSVMWGLPDRPPTQPQLRKRVEAIAELLAKP